MSKNESLLKPKFKLEAFAPVWGATVMGTGILTSVFWALSEHGYAQQIFLAIATVFYLLSFAIAVPIGVLTFTRWVKHSDRFNEDLAHPIKGAMMGTFAGMFLVLAVANNRVGALVLGTKASLSITVVFTVIGSVLALYIGFNFITGLFSRGNTKKAMITGTWFIPPVVIIIVPTAIAPILKSHTILSNELLWTSWMLLGMGFFIYTIIATILFYRAVTEALPPSALAPSLMIGVGPAGLISLNVVLLTQTSIDLGMWEAFTLNSALPVAIMMWGFGFWWLIATLIVLKRGYKKLPFALTWWGFTFPVGAWVVAGFVLSKVTGSLIIFTTSSIVAFSLLILWAYIVFKTVKGIKQNTIWEN